MAAVLLASASILACARASAPDVPEQQPVVRAVPPPTQPTPAPDPARLEPVPPPEILFTDLAGIRRELAGLRKEGRPVLVNFWATWCGPCAHELPMLGDLAREWGETGPAVMGVSLDHLTIPDDDMVKGKVTQMLMTRRVSYPNRIVRGKQRPFLDAFGIDGGIPYSILYDGRGRTVKTFRGAVDEKEIRETARALARNPPNQTVGS